jgi:GT2 family glycosyltransferase/glycosyltransferase involved in cell wall biosynthesis
MKIFSLIIAPILWLIFLPLILIFLLSTAIGKIFKKSIKEKKLPGLDSVSIVIVNYNGKALLKECLPSVLEEAERFQGQTEIIVVDNGSEDGSAEFLKENFQKVKVIELEKNYGFGKGANIGIEKSCNDIVILLNNDMKVERGFINNILKPFSHPDVFSATAQIFFEDPKKRREETGKTRGRWEKGFLKVWHADPVKEEGFVLYSGGGSTAYRRDIFLEIGGFDEIYYPFYVEDLDISYSAWKRGWKSVLVPESIVVHKHRGTIGRFYKEKEIEEILLKNNILFVWKNISNPLMLLQHWFYLPVHIIKKSLDGKNGFGVLMKCLLYIPAILKRRLKESVHSRNSDKKILSLSRKNLINEEGSMRILFLTPYYPYPPIHGISRVYNLIKKLSKNNEIYLLSFDDGFEDETQKIEMEKFCKEVKVVNRTHAVIKNITSINPTPVIEFSSKSMEEALNEMIERVEPHILQIEYTHLAHYVKKIKNQSPLTFLTEHDISFEFFKRKARVESNLMKKIWTLWEFLRMYHFETRIIKKFDGIFAVSERDAEVLKRFLKEKVFDCAPNGVDTEYFSYRGINGREKSSILFVGYFLHPPNVDAILYFAKEIFPIIKDEEKEIKVYVVGAYPPLEVLNLSEIGFKVTGKVPETRSYYQEKMVFIAPIRFGAGVKLKVLEAMSCGIPVVSTSLGAEGIPCENGRDIMIADKKEEFAEKILNLLKDENLWKKISENGRKLVEEKRSYDAIAKNMDEVYRRKLESLWSRR